MNDKKNITFMVLMIIIVFFSFALISLIYATIDIKYSKENGKSTSKLFQKNKFISRIFRDKNWDRVITELGKSSEETFESSWNYNGRIILSKSLFYEEMMYDQRKYRNLPNIEITNMRIWTGTYYQRLITNVTPNPASSSRKVYNYYECCI